MEAGLKLKEISYIQCEGFAAGELKHRNHRLDWRRERLSWPSCQIQSLPTILVEISKRSQPVVPRFSLIAEENVAKDTDDIVLTTVHPYLSPISMVVPTQLVAYFATLHRGLDVDKPRNLAKSVTVE